MYCLLFNNKTLKRKEDMSPALQLNTLTLFCLILTTVIISPILHVRKQAQ